MSNEQPEAEHERLLKKYYVPNMGMYTEPLGEVTALLRRLERNERLSEADCRFLEAKGLTGLSAYATHNARTGKHDRRLLRTSQERRRDATQQWRMLRERYGISFLEQDDYYRVRDILHRVDAGGRLGDEDCVWLDTIDSFTPELRRVFHRNEARHSHSEFTRTGNARDAINANSHYRKAGLAQEGIALMNTLDTACWDDKRLLSAFHTTLGGSLRDLGHHEDAIEAAQQGHSHDPRSFHPCTLLGALHYEAGDRIQGDAWFSKAIERGAKPEIIDAELRAIWKRSNDAQRQAMRVHLLASNPVRYAWADEHIPTRPNSNSRRAGQATPRR